VPSIPSGRHTSAAPYTIAWLLSVLFDAESHISEETDGNTEERFIPCNYFSPLKHHSIQVEPTGNSEKMPTFQNISINGAELPQDMGDVLK
jgi:hypothetical protein